MCDCGARAECGWKGWQCLPADNEPLVPAGPWVDLSHSLGKATPRVPFFPAPVFGRIRSQPDDLLNISRMEMVVHVGTHVDSPRHCFLDAPALDEVPLERLSGRGLVWHVDPQDSGVIDVSHFAGLERHLRKGDILLLDTGWHRLAGSPQYEDDHPALTLGAADWIVEHQVKLVGFDFPTPDVPVVKRGADFNYPVHMRLMAHGVLIAEHLTNLSTLRGKRVEVLCAALNIEGGDGAPARIVARPVQERKCGDVE